MNGNGWQHDPKLARMDIRGLASDSRKVRPGDLFAALPGTRVDGRDYIDEAIRHGAVVVLAPPGPRREHPRREHPRLEHSGHPVPVVIDDNPRRRLALMAARFFGRQPRTIAAVTGTNGKTSVICFTRQIWTELGRQAASLGTLGILGPGLDKPGRLTTPDPVELHENLAELAQAGLNHLAIEASSHGLDQCRLDGVEVVAAAFTNLSRDHLDYHGTTESYLKAKMRLFDTVMAPGGCAVLNADIPEFEALSEACRARRHRILSYGARGTEIRLDGLVPSPDGQRLSLTVQGRRREVFLPLLAEFQAMNALAALGLALATGGDEAASVAALAHLRGIPGRLQQVARLACGAAIYVDYAHTPDALAAVLEALRPPAAGRLSVLFGCGGDRDPGKRPVMGEIARRLADRVIVTDDNPRSEDPAVIRKEILAACPEAREIGDRGRAIHAAIAGLASGDILVIAGKGHERGQIIGDQVHPFDDAEAARAAVAEPEGARVT